jgi:hypothetical protein
MTLSAPSRRVDLVAVRRPTLETKKPSPPQRSDPLCPACHPYEQINVGSRVIEFFHSCTGVPMSQPLSYGASTIPSVWVV